MVIRLLLTILFLLCGSSAWATTWYLCTSPAGGWSNTGSWTSVSADQGTCAASLGAPAAGDTAILNSSSGNVSLDSSTADVAATVTMIGYTGTLTLTPADNLIVSGGTVTLGGTITGTGALKITGAETLTSSGVTWPGNLNLDVAGTVTLSNSGATWTTTGLCTYTLATNLVLTTTGDTLTCNGGLTMSSNAGATGTLATIIIGGGTWTGGTKSIGNSINLAGNITLSGIIEYATGTITYISGTITQGSSTLAPNGNFSLNTSGMSWFNISNVQTAQSPTITLLSNLSATGTLTQSSNGSSYAFSGNYNITLANLLIGDTNTGTASSFTLAAGQTLTVTNSLKIMGNAALNNTAFTVKSATPSSPTYINYTGAIANEVISNTNFTDITASGLTLLNYNGGTLTRTTNISNVTAANFGGAGILL